MSVPAPAARRASGSDASGEVTRERLLTAAAAVFAERGFRGATLREIAGRASANLASANYHFGSKQNLYLEVLRRQYEAIEQRLNRDGEGADGGLRAASSRSGLAARLEARVQAMLELLLEAPGYHGLLMQRELSDPSDALPLIVRRFIEPLRRDLEALIATLEPSLDPEGVERCTRSVVGQIYFYATHRPALLLLMNRKRYPAGFSAAMAAHITRFSLGGLAAVAAGRRGGATRKGST